MFKIAAQDVGAKVDPYTSVERAMAVGRTGTLADDDLRARQSVVRGSVRSSEGRRRRGAARGDARSHRQGRRRPREGRHGVHRRRRRSTRQVVAGSGDRPRQARGRHPVGVLQRRPHGGCLHAARSPAGSPTPTPRRPLADAKRLVSGPVTVIYGQKAHNVARERGRRMGGLQAAAVRQSGGRAVTAQRSRLERRDEFDGGDRRPRAVASDGPRGVLRRPRGSGARSRRSPVRSDVRLATRSS